MPVARDITLDMALDEMKRIRSYMLKHYPDMVANRKITPYTRDHRLAVNKKIIELLAQAKADKTKTFVSLLNQLQ